MPTAEQVFAHLRTKYQNAFAALPTVIGNEAVNWSKESFSRQGWLDESLIPWAARKPGAKNNKGRSILVRSGALRRSIRIMSIAAKRVVIGTDLRYARAHNYGFSGSVNVPSYTRHSYAKNRVGTGKFTKKGHERMKTVKTISGSGTVRGYTKQMNIPQRQFMGASANMVLRLNIVGKNFLLNQLNK